VIASSSVETLERELEVAGRAAREAGAVIMRYYARGGIEFATKSDKSPVTAADLAANAAIVARLAEAFPEDAILTEEAPDTGARFHKRRVWIVDPLDGTRDFIARTGDFCVHIALVMDTEAVLGVVYQPVVDALYYARRGGGAFVDQGGTTRPLTPSTRATASDVRVGISRTNVDPGLEQCLAAAGLFARAVGMGASVKHMALARGDLEAVMNLSPGEQEWDTCAPEVILREAGCTMTDGDGQPLRYNQPDLHRRRGSVASNGRCHALVLRVMAPCLPTPA
jgi:3'(2'), 5'-bisphosphate nucleotidase